MRITLLYLLSVFVLLCLANNAFSQSGNPKMDLQVRSLITELKMDSITRNKFLEIYQAYGTIMKTAIEDEVGWYTLYHVYKVASEIRDSEVKKILSKSQYKLYFKRQKKIDKEASKGI